MKHVWVLPCLRRGEDANDRLRLIGNDTPITTFYLETAKADAQDGFVAANKHVFQGLFLNVKQHAAPC